MNEVERCRQEIRAIEQLLRAGHPDVEGLCLALSDWRTELRILESMPGGMPLAKRELARAR